MRTRPSQPRPSLARRGVQLGLLAGLGLAFVLAPGPRELSAGGDDECPTENECSFRKPNVLFVLDYASAHNQVIDVQTQQTRWQAMTQQLAQIVQPGSFLSQNAHLALLRFGHDPDPDSPGTVIPGDSSGLVDGLALDLAWDDPETHAWHGCVGQTLVDVLAATPAPMLGLSEDGIGSWTKGALEGAAAQIAETQADHPEDQGERVYALVVLTDGIWTGPDGLSSPPEEEPSPAAAALFEAGVSTYVLAFAPSEAALASADALALAGGTDHALLGAEASMMALADMLQAIIDGVVPPNCNASHPRVMILLDASSSMLNTPDGSAAAAMGETTWEQARALITGDDNLFDVEFLFDYVPLEDMTYLGLAVFGGDLPAPGEQRLLGQYRRCGGQAFGWALDPHSSCVAPGCSDPWAGAPIDWTSTDSWLVEPCMGHSTLSHMPRCQGSGPCAGSGSFTHLGLELVADNQASYHAAHGQPGDPHPTDAETVYINLLITDGSYTGYSTDAQVEAALTGMFEAGVTTYVIGVGPQATGPDADPAVLTQLDQMASWGSGGAHLHFDPGTIAALEQVLIATYTPIEFGPCCYFWDCSDYQPNPECWGDTDDPDPNDESADDSGDGDGDPGDGDGESESESESESGESESSESSESGESGESGDPSESGAGGGASEDTGSEDELQIDDEGGCSCQTERGTPSPLAWTGLAVGVALLRRRRERASTPNSAHGPRR